MSVPGRKFGELYATRDAKFSSDEFADPLVCQPCNDDGNSVPAKGYCTDCEEYLCDLCFTHHRRARAYRYHVLQDTSSSQRASPGINGEDTAACSLAIDSQSVGKTTKAIHVTDVNVKPLNISVKFCTTGIALLPDNRLVVIEETTRTVLLVDTKQNMIKYNLTLTRMPWDVASITEDQVAVTVPGIKTIQLISAVSDVLSKVKEIKVNGKCHGIAKNDQTLVVTFVSPGKVEIIDMEGTVLRILETDSKGQRLFQWPEYVSTNPVDASVIYVSDYNKNTVICVTLEGFVQYIYKDDNLMDPSGSVIDKRGLIYVCGCESDNIHIISAQCEKQKVLITRANGISYPRSIAYCDKENKLYVGMSKDSVVKLFQLK